MRYENFLESAAQRTWRPALGVVFGVMVAVGAHSGAWAKSKRAGSSKAPSLPHAVKNETYMALDSPQAASEAHQGGAPKPIGWGGYDKVPPQYRELMLERLEIVKTLIRDHGRAYDYRIHTKKDLERVLADLAPPPPTSEESE